MNRDENVSWFQDTIEAMTTVGGTPIRERVAPMVEKGQQMTRLGQDIASEGVGLLRDLVHERPIFVFSVVVATALLLARFASVRALGTAAAIGVQAAKLAADDSNT
jgi:hypothetical protein